MALRNPQTNGEEKKLHKILQAEYLDPVIETLQKRELSAFRKEQQLRLPSKKTERAQKQDKEFMSAEQKRLDYIKKEQDALDLIRQKEQEKEDAKREKVGSTCLGVA